MRKTLIISCLVAALVFLVLGLIAFRKIILSPGVIGMEGEWNIPPFQGQFKQLFEEDFYIWGSTMGSFGMEHNSSGLYYKMLLYFISILGMDGGAISKSVSVLAIVLAGFSMFFLCNRIGIDTLPSIIAGVFYMMNPEVFNRFCVGHIGILLAYGFLPLTLVFFMNYIEGNRGFKTLLLAGLFLALACTDVRNCFIILIALLLFSLTYILHRRGNHSLRVHLRRVSVALLVALFIPFITQGHWTIPFAIDMVYGASGQVASAALGENIPIRFISSGGYELSDVLRLSGTHLPYWELAVRDSWVWRLVGFLPAIFAFLALLLKPKDQKTVFFATLATIGILMISAGKGPLGSTWLRLLESTSILWIFRSPIVFYPMVSLGFSVLIGLSAEVLKQHFYRIKEYSINIIHHGKVSITFAINPSRVNVASSLLTILVFFSILFTYAHPFFTGDFDGMMRTYEFDKNYEELWQQVSSDPEDFRVLMLPAPYPTLYSEAEPSSTPGYDMMSRYIGKDFLYYGKLYSPRLETFLIKTLYENRTENIADILSLSGVKYIIFDSNKRSTATDLGWALDFPEMQFTNDKLENALAQQRYLERASDMDSINVYLNEKYSDHIFPVNQVGLFVGDLNGLVGLSYIETIDLEKLGLIFVSQLSREELIAISELPNVIVIIQDGFFADFALTLASREYVLDPVQWVFNDSPIDGWTLMKWTWYRWHYQASLERIAFTQAPSSFDIPYKVTQEGNYEIYLKLYFGSDASNVTFSVDETTIEEVAARRSCDVGFRWVYLGPTYMNLGDHNLRIDSMEGENAVASVAVVPEWAMENAREFAVDLIQEKDTFVLSELEFSRWEDKEETPLFVPIFDDEESFWTVAYGGAGGLGVLTVAPESAVVKKGNASLKFSVSNGSYSYIGIDHDYSPHEDWNDYDTFSLWWYGRNTGNWFSIRLEDSAGVAQEWRPTENWTGWKRLVFSLREPDVYWGAPSNLSSIAKVRIAKYEVGEWYLDRSGLDVLRAQTGFADVGVSASEGSVLSTTYMPISTSPYVPKRGSYRVYVRATSETVPSSLTVKIDDFQSEIQLMPSSNEFRWYEVGCVNMSEGFEEIAFEPSGSDRICLDQLLIVEESNSSQMVTPVEITTQRVSPTEYVISARAPQPFYIFFSERYHNSWKIHIENGTQAQSYPANSFGNLFFVNKTGDLAIILKFEKQQLYEIGKYLSFSSFIILASLVLIPSHLLRSPIRNKLHQLRSKAKEPDTYSLQNVHQH